MKKYSASGSKPVALMRISDRGAGRLRTRRDCGLGQAMAEIAFVLPLFLALVFGVIEFSRAWAAKHALTIAAREGARILVLPYGAGLPYTTEGEVQAAAEAAVRAYMTSSGLPVANTTRITAVKVLPGADSALGTADDVYEAYSNAVRGERVGFVISHYFDTPLVAILGFFGPGQGPNNNQGQDNGSFGFKMGATCLMDHE